MPGKRTDPTKARKEQEAIVKDLEERQNVPQSDRMFPNLLEKGRRALNTVVERKRQRKNPPPSRAGADVIGFKKNNSPV